MLKPENLEVESFFPVQEPSAALSVTADSQSPHCIVYVSDCVSCFPEPGAVAY